MKNDRRSNFYTDHYERSQNLEGGRKWPLLVYLSFFHHWPLYQPFFHETVKKGISKLFIKFQLQICATERFFRFAFSHKSRTDVQIDSRGESIKLIKISTYHTKESRAYSSLLHENKILILFIYSFFFSSILISACYFSINFLVRYVLTNVKHVRNRKVETKRTIRVTRNFQTAGAFLQPNIKNCLTQRKVNELVLQCLIYFSFYSIPLPLAFFRHTTSFSRLVFILSVLQFFFFF